MLQPTYSPIGKHLLSHYECGPKWSNRLLNRCEMLRSRRLKPPRKNESTDFNGT